ncbi:MAG: hypothetical protein MI757_14340 [Pirellulales bacterium]|nr:hypothetical protein [Pirellulales bacterium]
MRTRIETQKISRSLVICQASKLNRLGMRLVATSGDAPLYTGRRLREAFAAIVSDCRHGLEAVAAAIHGMHQPCMSMKPRLDWLVTKPKRLGHSVG